MGWIAFGLVIALIITIVLWVVAANNGGDDWWGVVAATIASVSSAVIVVTAIMFAFVVYDYQAADYKAQIINREYGTSYTQDEVFWAEDVIDTIREIDRTRIEVNGNLLRSDE